VDWDTALRENNGRVNPLGLYDLDRKPRKVAEIYKRMIKNWERLAPTASNCLKVPIDMSIVVQQLEEASKGNGNGGKRSAKRKKS